MGRTSRAACSLAAVPDRDRFEIAAGEEDAAGRTRGEEVGAQLDDVGRERRSIRPHARVADGVPARVLDHDERAVDLRDRPEDLPGVDRQPDRLIEARWRRSRDRGDRRDRRGGRAGASRGSRRGRIGRAAARPGRRRAPWRGSGPGGRWPSGARPRARARPRAAPRSDRWRLGRPGGTRRRAPAARGARRAPTRAGATGRQPPRNGTLGPCISSMVKDFELR